MNITESGAIILGVVGSLIIALLLIAVWLIFQVAARWKIFTKAGEEGWKSLVPFYSTYTQYRITWNNSAVFWIWLAIYIVNALTQMGGDLVTEEYQFVQDIFPVITDIAQILNTRFAFIGILSGLASYVLSVMSMLKLSRAFGHGVLFALGLFFLNPIFMLILGFGSSEYQGPQ